MVTFQLLTSPSSLRVTVWRRVLSVCKMAYGYCPTRRNKSASQGSSYRISMKREQTANALRQSPSVTQWKKTLCSGNQEKKFTFAELEENEDDLQKLKTGLLEFKPAILLAARRKCDLWSPARRHYRFLQSVFIPRDRLF